MLGAGIPDLAGYRIFPGLVNAHDHLEFAMFPKLGSGPYPNAREWARDVYRPDAPPVKQHLLVPKRLRLIWGGLRNLLAGVTTVCHHNPYEVVFDEPAFPLRVVKEFGWAHSLEFEDDVAAKFRATPPGSPFIIHVGEGTDHESAREVFRLAELGALTERTVLVHAVALDAAGWKLVTQAGASVVWCPRSNLFTLGRTLNIEQVPKEVRIALATDSPITAEGDLLDELHCEAAMERGKISALMPLVTVAPSSILNLPVRGKDWIAAREFGSQPELVVIEGEVKLVRGELAFGLPDQALDQLNPIHIEGRPSAFVRCDVQTLIDETAEALGTREIRLGGRRVWA